MYIHIHIYIYTYIYIYIHVHNDNSINDKFNINHNNEGARQRRWRVNIPWCRHILGKWVVNSLSTPPLRLICPCRHCHCCYCHCCCTANFGTRILDFGGFDLSIILNLRGGILMSMGNFPESTCIRPAGCALIREHVAQLGRRHSQGPPPFPPPS